MGRSGRLLVLVAVGLVVLLLTGRTLAGYYVEALWFSSVGYSSIFWKQLIWLWGLRLGVASVTTAVLFVNLRIVGSTLGGIQIKRRYGNIEIAEQVPPSYVTMFAVGISLLVGLWSAAALPGDAVLGILAYLSAGPTGVLDPVLGQDLSFYLFALPVRRGIFAFALALLAIVTVLSVTGYAITGAVRWGRGRPQVSDVPRLHLAGLVIVAIALLAWRYRLARYGLLLDGNGFQGIFGYADARGRLAAYRVIGVLALVGAAGVLWTALSRRPLPALASLGAFLVAVVGLGAAYPAFLQRLTVEPNELERETPYIEWNLEFTRRGFGLDALSRVTLEPRAPGAAEWERADDHLSGIPVWTRDALLTTFRQVEARYSYYDFPDVAVDRYSTPEGPVPVAVSVREINRAGIEEPNWQNLHLRDRFIIGMGAVASSAALSSLEGRPRMYLTSIPPTLESAPYVPQGLALERPAVFFGSRAQEYAIVNTRAPASAEGMSGEGEVVVVDYPGGIRLDSFLRTLAFAWRFQDANLLFAAEVTDSSRFVFRRQVIERAQALAPFLTFLEPAYPVIHAGRIVWLLDGFTVSRDYPLATPYALRTNGPQINYVRNSVKATVDGVTGDVSFFVADTTDVLLAAYRATFPELFQDLAAVPAGLESHLRYPVSLLNLQATVLAQYHQDTAASFHGQHDVWATPSQANTGVPLVPYGSDYSFLQVPGEDSPEFVLSTVFVPAGRQNLTALFLARCDPQRYGELILVELPREGQIASPRQVEALVEQDPGISEQLSLWRQSGSQVWSGRLFVVPVGEALFFTQGIFLAAEQGAIPELRRVIVSDGNRVVMAPGLRDAIEGLRSAAARSANAAVDGPRPAPQLDVGVADWPARALRLLEEAEAHARSGNWPGYGDALSRLRALLQRLAGRGAR
ncbi:MAG: UPF0182 family protein [Gemmatimonadetes bacterium]|nr:UPF0182 family protein [Gemmatimonadota bacterium]